MGERYKDWFRQAQADLEHARHSLVVGDYDWSCFAAHQAAEKVLISVFLSRGIDARGNSITVLMDNLLRNEDLSPMQLLDASRELDRYFSPTRYPDVFDVGAPADFYTKKDAESAIMNAQEIIDFCTQKIS